MKLSEISQFLSCTVFCGEELLDKEIKFGCASDLMSDVLAFSRAGAVLLTGLVNIQTINTAFLAEIDAIVLVRGKTPDERMIDMARMKNIPVLGTAYSMYEACGILYNKGLESTMECLVAKVGNG